MIIEARDDTITLRGEVKTNLWPAIQAAAALLLEKHPTGIIIDASAVSKCTTRGAETFADAFQYISAHNARIVVAGLAPELLEVGKGVPGVRSQLPLAASVEDARASLDLDEVVPQRGKARIAGVVPMVGDWRRTIRHAAKLAEGENCELHLVDLIKTPRTLPIGSPLPERESAGQKRLEAAAALVAETGLKSFPHAEHVRSEYTGLIDFVDRLSADFAVISLDRGAKEDPHVEESEAMTLLEAAKFEVSLIKGAPADLAKFAQRMVVPAVGAWSHALEHACKLARREENALVTVVYLIAVPRTAPIDALDPDAEAAAADCAREANRIGRKYGVSVNPIVERVRDPVLGFLKLFEPNEFGLAVVGVRRQVVGDYHITRAIAESLMRELPCETVLLRVGD